MQPENFWKHDKSILFLFWETHGSNFRSVCRWTEHGLDLNQGLEICLARVVQWTQALPFWERLCWWWARRSLHPGEAPSVREFGERERTGTWNMEILSANLSFKSAFALIFRFVYIADGLVFHQQGGMRIRSVQRHKTFLRVQLRPHVCFLHLCVCVHDLRPNTKTVPLAFTLVWKICVQEMSICSSCVSQWWFHNGLFVKFSEGTTFCIFYTSRCLLNFKCWMLKAKCRWQREITLVDSENSSHCILNSPTFCPN